MENTPKLTLAQYEYLKDVVAKTIQDYPDWRLGQTWFNELIYAHPDFGWIRTTKLDPFFRDEVLLDLFFHILDDEAYASWTHSDDYKRLHKEWTDNHPATPVDTSGSELSDFVDAPLMLEYPVETISGSALEQWAEEDAVFEKEYIKARNLIMNNAQVNIVNENETTPIITNNSTSTATITLNPGAAIGYNPGLLQSNSVTGQGLVYSGNYEPKIEETTNVRLNITTHRSPLECVELLKQISDMLGTLEDIRVRNLEISQW